MPDSYRNAPVAGVMPSGINTDPWQINQKAIDAANQMQQLEAKFRQQAIENAIKDENEMADDTIKFERAKVLQALGIQMRAKHRVPQQVYDDTPEDAMPFTPSQYTAYQRQEEIYKKRGGTRNPNEPEYDFEFGPKDKYGRVRTYYGRVKTPAEAAKAGGAVGSDSKGAWINGRFVPTKSGGETTPGPDVVKKKTEEYYEDENGKLRVR